MLQKMRSGVISGLFMGLLVLAAGGLILTDAGGFFTGGLTANTVASFGGKKMNIQTFDVQLRNYLREASLTPDQAYKLGMVDQYLSTEINLDLLDSYLHRQGVRVDDETLAKRLAVLLEPFTKDGITKKEGLKRTLEAKQISEAAFVEGYRGDLARETITGAFVTLPVSEKLQKDLAAFQTQKRIVQVAYFADADAKIEAQPTEDDLKEHYEAIKNSFATPAQRSGVIGFYPPDAITKGIKITDEDLLAYYTENEEKLKKPEKRKLQQALLNDIETADKVAKLVNEGKALEEAAEEATKAKNSFLGEASYEKSVLPEELAEPVFTARPDTIVGPIETSLGVYVVKLVEIIPSQAPDIAALRTKYEEALKTDKAASQYYDMVADIEARLQGGEKLTDIAKTHAMKLDNFTKVSAADIENGKLKVTGFKAGSQFLQSVVFPEEDTGAYGVHALPDGSTVFIEVTEDVPAGFLPFEQVQEKVKTAWLAREKHAANVIKVQGFLPQLNKDETTLEKVAGGKLKTVTLSKADKNDTVSPTMRMHVFGMSSGEYSMVPSDAGVSLVKVESITFNKAENARMDDIDKEQLQSQWISSLIAHLRREANVRVNQSLLQRIYGGNAG